MLDDEADADRRAWHRAAAATAPDDEAAEALARTADHAASRGGHTAAARALERAAELDSDPQRRAQRLVARRGLVGAGGPRRPCGGAARSRRARPAGPAGARHGDAGARDGVDGHRAPRRRVRDARRRGPHRAADGPARRARAADARLHGGRGQRRPGRHPRHARPSSTPSRARTPSASPSRLMNGISRLIAGDAATGVASIEEALALADDLEVVEQVQQAGGGAVFVGDWVRARRYFDRAIVLARDRGAIAAAARDPRPSRAHRPVGAPPRGCRRRRRRGGAGWPTTSARATPARSRSRCWPGSRDAGRRGGVPAPRRRGAGALARARARASGRPGDVGARAARPRHRTLGRGAAAPHRHRGGAPGLRSPVPARAELVGSPRGRRARRAPRRGRARRSRASRRGREVAGARVGRARAGRLPRARGERPRRPTAHFEAAIEQRRPHRPARPRAHPPALRRVPAPRAPPHRRARAPARRLRRLRVARRGAVGRARPRELRATGEKAPQAPPQPAGRADAAGAPGRAAGRRGRDEQGPSRRSSS